jgi:hypothetical protein
MQWQGCVRSNSRGHEICGVRIEPAVVGGTHLASEGAGVSRLPGSGRQCPADRPQPTG